MLFLWLPLQFYCLALCFTPVHVRAPVTGLRIHFGAPDLKMGAGRHDRPVLRGTRGTRIRLQAAASHQAAGRQDSHAQAEVQEEGGPLQLDL